MPQMLGPAKLNSPERQATTSQYDIHISDPIADIVDLVLAFMAVGFIMVIMVKVFRARNGESGVGLADVDLEMGHEMVD